MVIRKNADETEFEIVLEGQKSLEEIEYDIQESPYSLFTDHPIMIDPARNIHYLVPPKDPVWPKQLWTKLNRMIEDSHPITEEEYAQYHRRMEHVEWMENCPFYYILVSNNPSLFNHPIRREYYMTWNFGKLQTFKELQKIAGNEFNAIYVQRF